jgi:hypothetical protein
MAKKDTNGPIALFFFSLGTLSVAIALGLATLTKGWQGPVHEPTVEERVRVLTQALQQSASVISAIESEINSRMNLVTRLEEQARTAQRLYETNREEVEAIASVLRGEISRNDTWNFWLGLAQDFLFTVFGVCFGYLVGWWMNRRKLRQKLRAGSGTTT